MEFGVSVNQQNFELAKQTALECEKLGFDTVYVADHILPRSLVPYSVAREKEELDLDQPILEGWTLLTALACVTDKIRIGTHTLNNAFREPPSILTKMATTLDNISRGRLILGMGAGYNEPEFIQYGVPYPSYSKRLGMLEEALQVIKLMWTEEKPSFQGEYYKIEDVILNPKPVQKPHPPILIGGRGKKTLRVVAKYADIWSWPNSNLCTPELYQGTLEILNRYCEDMGRNPMAIAKLKGAVVHIGQTDAQVRDEVQRFKPPELSWEDYSKHLIGTPEEIISQMEEYIKMGATGFELSFPLLSSGDLRGLRLFAEMVMPHYK
jgi:alkanesulfonate monooxygenase SsuD/methylene tetrahydromethanopterin reductase-like flavin-dependent oxidoreductase (luciferase family)